MGGGTGLFSLNSRSLLSSPERRGGGGDGGCDAAIRGDLPVSKIGVCGRPGILNGFGVAGDAGFARESVLRKAGRSPTATSGPLFGGDWGGSIMRDGGCTGLGLMGGGSGLVGEPERLILLLLGPLPWFRDETVNLSLGLVFGIGGGSRAVVEGLGALCGSSGFGAGESVRGGGGADEAGCESFDLFMFSNLARSDDTGLWRRSQQGT